MKILGLHVSFTGFAHDSSAALIDNGKIIAAVEEERFNRYKSSQLFFPSNSIKYCLKKAKCDIRNIDLISVDGYTFKKLKEKIIKSIKYYFGYCPKVEINKHSLSHSYGTFLSSGYKKSLVVSIDGVGDKVSTTVSKFEIKNKKVFNKIIYSEGLDKSLGDFYGVFTNYLGFRLNEGEYKVMGMSAYGTPKYDLSKIITVDSKTGTIISNLNKIISRKIVTNINEPIYDEKKIFDLIKVKRRLPSEKIEKEHFNLASSVQKQFTYIYTNLINFYAKKENLNHLCLAGGCALNCLANYELLNNNFKKIYVMPASSDRGLSLCNALYSSTKNKILPKPPKNMFLGPEFTNKEIISFLRKISLDYKVIKDHYKDCAKEIKNGMVVAWFQGRSEFGPRALGSRSILANPKIKNMKKILNLKIKYREDYRPFAPSIIEEDLRSFTKFKDELEYMTFTIKVSKKLKKKIPEAVHFDGTSRIHLVKEKSNPIFFKLLKCVKEKIGVGSVINTSFNINNEPIVNSPIDAIRTFFSSGIDVMYMNNIKLTKY